MHNLQVEGVVMMKRRALFAGCAVALSAACAFGLVGCGAKQHEIIDQGKSCASCHSDNKQTYEVDLPASAAQSTGQVNVKTNASQVIIAKPTFISQDGSKFVPEQVSTQSVSDGQATVQLGEGTWAVCTNEGQVKAKLVVVSAQAAGAADVEL